MAANPDDPAGPNIITATRSNQYTRTGTLNYFTEWTLSMPHDLSFTAGLGNSTMRIELNDRVYTLNLKKYMEEQKEIKDLVKEMERLTKTQKANPVELLPEDITRYDADQAKKDRQTQWLNNLKNDIYLNETVNVVNNMISQQAIVKSK